MDIKKIFYGTCIWLLVTTVFGVGIAWGAYQTFNTPEPLKTAIKDSGLYENGVSAALQQSAKDSKTTQDLPIDQPEVRQLVENAFTPEYTQKQAERAIDSLYAWLHGDSKNLSFNIDLSGVKDRLISGVDEYVGKRLDTLPACTSADQLPANGEFDPFSASCLPPGTDKSAIMAQVTNKISEGELFKPQTASDTQNEQNATAGNTQLQNGPAIYNALMIALYGAIISAVLFGVGVVFFSPTWQRGLRRLGIALMVTGAVSGLAAWLTSIGLDKLFEAYAKSATGNQVLQEGIFKVVASLVNDMQGYWTAYAVLIVGLGAVSFLAWHFLKPSDAETAQTLAHGMPDMKPESTPTAPAGQSEHKNKRAEKLPEIKN